MHLARGAARTWSTVVAAIVFGGLTLAIIGSTALAQSRPTRSTSLDTLELQIRTLTQKIDRIENTLNGLQTPILPQE